MSTRAVLVTALVPILVVLVVVMVIVLGRGSSTDAPDCASRNVDGSDSLVCGTTTSPTAAATSS